MTKVYSGKIIAGNKIGRKMGIPTVNIPVEGDDLPEFGVYAASVKVYMSKEDDRTDTGLNEINLKGVANLGIKPTVENADGTNPVAIEVNLFDFAGDIYGREITVELEQFIRPERKFEDFAALQAQIESDIRTAKLFFVKKSLRKEKCPAEYREQKAMDLFLEGYTCAQSVLLAFSDVLDMDPKSLARISSGFGGGMGRLREVCGTVSGMFMVANLIYGFELPKDAKEKGDHYARIQELAKRFEEDKGSIVCRDLLGLAVKREEPAPCERTVEYYTRRPCKELVGQAARIVTEYILEDE